MMNGIERSGEFLIKLCKKFDQHNIKYLLLRNYEQYPFTITGDIDFVVESQKKEELTSVFETLVIEEGWIILKRAKYPFLVGFLIFDKNISITRKFLAFDFFIDFTYRGFYLQSFSSLYAKHDMVNNFRCLDSSNYAWMTFLHYFFFKGNIPIKYREDIYNIIVRSSIGFDSKYVPSVCIKYFVNSIKKNKWQTNRSIRFIFLTIILLKNLINHPSETVCKTLNIFSFYLNYFFHPSLYVVFSKPISKYQKDSLNLSTQLIQYIHKYHLFSKKSSIITHTNWYWTLIKIFKIICFRGLPIIAISEKYGGQMIDKLFSRLGFYLIYLEMDNNSIILTKKRKEQIFSSKIILNNLPITESSLSDISGFILS